MRLSFALCGVAARCGPARFSGGILVGEGSGTGERRPGGAGERATHHLLEVSNAALEKRRVDSARVAARVEPALHPGDDGDVLLVGAIEGVAPEVAEHRALAAEVEAARDEADALRADRIDAQ